MEPIRRVYAAVGTSVTACPAAEGHSALAAVLRWGFLIPAVTVADRVGHERLPKEQNEKDNETE